MAAIDVGEDAVLVLQAAENRPLSRGAEGPQTAGQARRGVSRGAPGLGLAFAGRSLTRWTLAGCRQCALRLAPFRQAAKPGSCASWLAVSCLGLPQAINERQRAAQSGPSQPGKAQHEVGAQHGALRKLGANPNLLQWRRGPARLPAVWDSSQAWEKQLCSHSSLG